MKITAEIIKQNYPAIYWQIYRQGFAAAQNDPNAQAQAAKMHLERSLTKLQTPPAAKPSPQPQGALNADIQRAINKQLGISDEDFHQYATIGR